jgi:hypothetical protein
VLNSKDADMDRANPYYHYSRSNQDRSFSTYCAPSMPGSSTILHRASRNVKNGSKANGREKVELNGKQQSRLHRRRSRSWQQQRRGRDNTEVGRAATYRTSLQ